MNIARRIVHSAAIAGSAYLTACAGGSDGGSPATVPVRATAAPFATLAVAIKWPDPRATAKRLRPNYLSNGTQSVAVAVNGGAPVTANNPNLLPGASPGTKTTSLAIRAPLGPVTLTISDYDTIEGKGKLLARATLSYTVIEGQANAIVATLDGNLDNIEFAAMPNTGLTDAKPTYTFTGAFAQTFDLTPRDGSNNVIIAPGVLPALTLVSSDPSAVAVSKTGTMNEFTLTPLKADATVTMTAAGTTLDGAPVTNTFTVKTLGLIYVMNSDTTCQDSNGNAAGTSKVTAYGENGVPFALPSGSFGGIFGCGQGLMYAPAASGAAGSLYVGYKGIGTPVQSLIQAFDLLGATVALPAGSFPFWDAPQYSRFAPEIGAAGEFLMVVSVSGQGFHTYDPIGTLIHRAGEPAGTTDFVQLVFTTSVAHDTNAGAHAGEFYFSNACFAGGPPPVHPCSLQEYKADGTVVKEIDVGSAPQSLVFDPHNAQLYVTNTTLGFVSAYTESLANGVAAPFPGLLSADDIAFNPGTNTLYVTDHMGNAVKAFAEDGTPSTIPVTTGAFPNISNPQGLVIVP